MEQIQDLVGPPGPRPLLLPPHSGLRTGFTQKLLKKKHVKTKAADRQDPFPQATHGLASRMFFLPFQGAFAALQDVTSLNCQEGSCRVWRSAELERAGSETSGHPTPPNQAPLATAGVSYTNLCLDCSSHSRTQEDARSCLVRARRGWDPVGVFQFLPRVPHDRQPLSSTHLPRPSLEATTVLLRGASPCALVSIIAIVPAYLCYSHQLLAK